MQWLINELKVWKAELVSGIETKLAEFTARQIEAATEIQKLKGEITAMKARMGKKQD